WPSKLWGHTSYRHHHYSATTCGDSRCLPSMSGWCT
ncbi:unnamed protein product, partial [Callosobruchus maculatus]